MNRNGPVALAFHAFVVLFTVAPILTVCVVAFTPNGYLSLPTHGVSLRWFYAIADRPEFLASFRTSLWLAALASTLAVALALPAALAIGRLEFHGRGWLLGLFQSPLMIPHLVLVCDSEVLGRAQAKAVPWSLQILLSPCNVSYGSPAMNVHNSF